MHIYSPLWTRYGKEPFLERMVTGDDKWILYNNIKRKTQWGLKEGVVESVKSMTPHTKSVVLLWVLRDLRAPLKLPILTLYLTKLKILAESLLLVISIAQK